MSDSDNLDEAASGAAAELDDESGGGISTPLAPATTNDQSAAYAGWAYLASLFVIFGVLALVAYSSDGDSSGANVDGVAAVETTEASTPLNATELVYLVERDSVTLTGSVPDMTARDQLVGQARDVYGETNVVDELVVDSGMTMDGGSVRVTGNAANEDDRPALLLGLAATVGGLSPTLDVAKASASLTPVDAELAVSADASIKLGGIVPDEASRLRLIENAEQIYGPGNVDATNLTVGDATWDDGEIRLIGIVDPGDTLAEAMQELLERDNPGITVSNTVEIDSSPEALGRLQDKLAEELAAEPILFATNSANISSDSDTILQRVANAMNTIPEVPVEIVGHTDDQGRAATNQALSEARATAVMARLVELGVDAARLSSRGAGEDEPIATNNTEAGRQQNRRIEFLFEGATQSN